MEMMKGEESFGVVQMNHYPVCWQPHRTMGMAPHTDSSLLTLLYQGGVEGLQFQLHRQRHEEWIVAPALPNGLVVILGDLIQVLSNGRYKSAVHRAVPNSRRSRISLAYIWGPSLNAVIKPSPDLVDSHHPLSYKAFTWSEYLRAKAVHFNTTLQFFKQSLV
uniref:Fe2OG dioxygenase domain-containing protein n=1 Tax=Araucaria cunninghamii TaxID=56994 RepID=A0A0D6QR83_ARACU